ncbi:L10-interacting MYB domain-containing protein-like [Solanum verrucosum]|uniref:L10-interacting MYB domain-containing protein-like n=1 Tax=Solanum verrucosum TaxID=315347 RepID=UPI0020D0F537|nr:L10-interacting MYB domain-containing protein-like [Solanum verrucosum]
MSETKTNAKWDDDAHLKFIELCELEIRKGNRPNTHLSRDGWKNTIKAFYEKTGRRYKKKQMKNHWDGMKAEWTLFKQLMRGDTSIGWDATKNTIMADDDWWKRKIKEDVRYRKFRNKDLSLIWFRYDALFSDIVATGEIARASNQSQFFETEVDSDEERPNGIDNDDMEHFINSNNEGRDESDDPQDMDSTMFPIPSLKRPNPTDGIGTSNQVKKSKTKSTAASMKEDMHSLVELMSNNSTATSHAVDDPTIDKCMDFLANILGIFERGEMYNYFVNMFLKKNIRQVFLKMPTDEARKSWMEYNYQLYLKKV